MSRLFDLIVIFCALIVLVLCGVFEIIEKRELKAKIVSIEKNCEVEK